MTTTFEIDRNNITSTITLADSWALPGDVAIEETMNNRVLYAARISAEGAVNFAYELLGNGWRVTSHTY